jgi:RHS repeat-associated protein
VDGVTGENVSYAYDSLNRLIAASTTGTGGVQWGNSYSYDGFGNLTGKTVTKGTAPTLSPLVDSNTNRVRLSGDYGYDANGNWLGAAGAPNTWNVENQLLSTGAKDGNQNPITYTYDPWGRRVLQYSASGTYGPIGTLYFYSITGQRLATYSAGYPTQTVQLSVSMYFGKRPLRAMDRIGSVRGNRNGAIAYFPWGEERPRSDGTLTADGTDKFATYFRDGFGQDYAHSRYYNSNMGRFWSPDPGWRKSSKLGNPTNFDRYAYSLNDPINFYDPVGRNPCDDPQDDGNDACDADPGPGAGPGGGGGAGSIPWSPTCGPNWASDASLSGDCSSDPCKSTQALFLFANAGGGSCGGNESTDLPPLHCDFDQARTVNPPGAWENSIPGGYGFYDLMQLSYTATGGTGNYSWGVVQMVGSFGYLNYTTGGGLVNVYRGDTFVRGEFAQDGPSFTFTDAPGVPFMQAGGFLLNGFLIDTFSTSVFVTSGGQIANCPTVYWTAWVAITGPTTNFFRPNATGQATITGVSQGGD